MNEPRTYKPPKLKAPPLGLIKAIVRRPMTKTKARPPGMGRMDGGRGGRSGARAGR